MSGKQRRITTKTQSVCLFNPLDSFFPYIDSFQDSNKNYQETTATTATTTTTNVTDRNTYEGEAEEEGRRNKKRVEDDYDQ